MSDDPSTAYRKAHARYYLARQNTFLQAIVAARRKGFKRDLAITEIDGRTLEAWQTSWHHRRHWTGEGGFAWDVLSRRYRKKPRSFHAAFWSDTFLCGLAVGWLSPGHQQLTLHFLESAPDARHPLRGDIAYLAFTTAELYGRAVGARRLMLRNPLPGISEHYEGMGFRLRTGVVESYTWRGLSPDWECAHGTRHPCCLGRSRSPGAPERPAG